MGAEKTADVHVKHLKIRYHKHVKAATIIIDVMYIMT